MKRVLPVTRAFLYLNLVEHVATWVSGGNVPLSLASTYKSTERRGTKTPDEGLIHDCPVDMTTIPRVHIKNSRNVSFYENTYNGVPMPEFHNGSLYEEDALVMCMSTACDETIAARLGNKAACVEVLDVERLKQALDKQLGRRGICNPCSYTADHQRGHFLKGVEDRWQLEYRIAWPGLNQGKDVRIPPGTARLVTLFTRAA